MSIVIFTVLNGVTLRGCRFIESAFSDQYRARKCCGMWYGGSVVFSCCTVAITSNIVFFVATPTEISHDYISGVFPCAISVFACLAMSETC